MEGLSKLITVGVFLLGIGFSYMFQHLWSYDRKWWRKYASKEEKPIFRNINIVFILGIITLISLFFLPEEINIIGVSNYSLRIFSFILAFLSSFIWFKCLTWLDIFEKEKYKYLLLVFLLSCASIWLVFPMSNFLHDFYGFNLNGNPWNDWWYCVFGIGMIEESVKILPVVLILRFTKQINEPIDYLLYGAVSALGFAFVENNMYIFDSELRSVEGRILYATVGHMFDTSIICYGLAMRNIIYPKLKKIIFPIALLLASIAHGFYDFWLINPAATQFSFLTFFFVLIAVKWWLVMSNNLINISNHFTYKKKHKIRYFKYWMFNGFMWIFILAIVFIHLLYGKESAGDFFGRSFFNYIFLFVFITLNFNSFNVIKNYIQPFAFPKKWYHLFAPNLEYHDNIVGEKLHLAHRKTHRNMVVNQDFKNHLPLTGQLIRRRIADNDKEWYLMKIDKGFLYKDKVLNYLYIKPSTKDDELFQENYQAVEIRLPGALVDIDNPIFELKNTYILKNILSKSISSN